EGRFEDELVVVHSRNAVGAGVQVDRGLGTTAQWIDLELAVGDSEVEGTVLAGGRRGRPGRGAFAVDPQGYPRKPFAILVEDGASDITRARMRVGRGQLLRAFQHEVVGRRGRG